MRRSVQQGVTLLEVLVTIVILSFGLLGLAGLQARAMTAEMESYQRGQAIVLLQDISDRITSNGANAASYVTASPEGTGATDAADCSTLGSRAAIDLCEWSKAIKGSSETKTSGGVSSKVGAMIDGRGCVAAGSTANTYIITVVWQGTSATVAPSSSCGQNLYTDSYGATNDATRRAVSTTITVPNLSAS